MKKYKLVTTTQQTAWILLGSLGFLAQSSGILRPVVWTIMACFLGDLKLMQLSPVIQWIDWFFSPSFLVCFAYLLWSVSMDKGIHCIGHLKFFSWSSHFYTPWKLIWVRFFPLKFFYFPLSFPTHNIEGAGHFLGSPMAKNSVLPVQGGLDSYLWSGTRPLHAKDPMLQWRLKIPSAATKNWPSQINK